MIKVLHFSDVHLGVENYGRVDPHTGLSARLTDFLKSLDQIVDTALEEEVDLVVFSGDAYKTRNPSPTHQREFAKRVRRLSLAGLPTVLIAGNHDVSGRAHTMEIFDTLGVEHVYVARYPGVLDIKTQHGPVQVGTLPWISHKALLAREEYVDRNFDELTELTLHKIDAILNDDLVTYLDPDVPHILVAHCGVQGGVYGSGYSALGQDLILPLSLFENPLWDYVALGHYHRHQVLAESVVYSGSIERVDFGEEHEDKGFIIAQVERGQCTWEFRKLDVRSFATVRVTANESDPTAQVVSAIEQAQVDGSVVRVIISTTAEMNVQIREDEIRRALKPAFYVFSIIRDVIRPERQRFGGPSDTIGLTPLQMLDRYLQAKQVPPERITVLTSRAEALLQGER